MINRLRDEWRTVADIADRFGVNAGGGVALWDLPPAFSRAFNPIIATRTRYYFRTDGYEPSRGPRPNIAALKADSKREITLNYPADVPIYVCITTGKGARTVLFPAGSRQQTASGDVVSIDGFKTAAAEPVREIFRTPEFTYMAQGIEFEDENYLVATNGAVLYVADDIDTTYLDVYRDGAAGARLSAESFRGVTTFDLSPVVRLWFAPQLRDVNTQSPYVDGRLFVEYALHGLGGTGTQYKFMALNAVAQVGTSSNMGSYRGQLLTERRRFYLYAGYPLDFAALDERVIDDSVGVQRYPVPGAGETAADYFGAEIVPACTPPQPFYVRWINADGGTEYFMFGRRQVEAAGVKSSNVYELYVPDPAEVSTNRRAYGITTEHAVTVGAAGVPEEEYLILRGLPFAPTIEWFDGRRWVGLTVSKFDDKRDTSNATHDIEITFQLPAINTQF